MTRAILSLTLAAVVAPVAAAQARSPAGSHCPAVTPAQVEAQFARFNAAWATKDPAKVTALFTRDAVLLATVSNRPRTTPAEVNDYFVSFLKNSPVGTINTSTVKIDCRSAARLGTWTVALTNPETGAKSEVKARYSFIYRYVDGDWKIDHLHSSMMPEAGH
ncbi:MAG: SgcJ/EcaC family oxidoreductase [Chakrabartia sp.]